jgi:antitoxin YefM
VRYSTPLLGYNHLDLYIILHISSDQPKRPDMTILTYTDARNNLASAMDRVVQDRDPAIITRTGREAVVMVAQSEWDAIQETLHLLSSPKNAARLRDAIAELDAGGGDVRTLA